MTSTWGGRWAIGLLVAFECLLLLIAFVGYGSQGNSAQDEPIAFNVVLIAILAAGNVLAFFGGVVTFAVMLVRARHAS